jgi:broad specificity phosphatase PhoE
MPRLHLVRHGEAAAGWGDDLDPGLSDRGRAQAEAMAAELAPFGPLPVLVSPLRRCRETAEPLLARWQVKPTVEPRVSELPSPPGSTLESRTQWLRALMSGTWADGAPELDGWRRDVISCLVALDADTVVVTHFIAINVIVGCATDDDRVVCQRLANCSVTVVDVDGGALRLVHTGAEASTEVL